MSTETKKPTTKKPTTKKPADTGKKEDEKSGKAASVQLMESDLPPCAFRQTLAARRVGAEPVFGGKTPAAVVRLKDALTRVQQSAQACKEAAQILAELKKEETEGTTAAAVLLGDELEEYENLIQDAEFCSALLNGEPLKADVTAD